MGLRQPWEMIRRIFALEVRGITVRREVTAGMTTFAAMAYILAVNPSILAATGMDKGSLITATALASSCTWISAPAAADGARSPLWPGDWPRSSFCTWPLDDADHRIGVIASPSPCLGIISGRSPGPLSLANG